MATNPEEPTGHIENAVVKKVDMTEAPRTLWVMKIPRYVGEAWKLAKDGELLGEVVLQPPPPHSDLAAMLELNLKPDAPCRTEAGQRYRDTVALERTGVDPRVVEERILGKRKRMLSGLAESSKRGKLVDPSAGSTSFSVTVEHTDDKKLNVFSEDADGESVTWEGFVRYRCDARPRRDQRYQEVCEMRSVRNTEKNRVVKFAEDARVRRDGLMDAPLLQKDNNVTHKRREKMHQEELEAKLFDLFSERPFWTLKDLEAKLEQPSSYIREVLSKLCIYHKKAPNKNNYELKAEYKVHRTEEVDDRMQ
eukprot:TRINITY_DN13037_c0_g1_i1.p1 TRINITY_DN13037_c0_g1~~TRINITY_DN13037_c0_g1_i1.p1  ORF type:complete len:307 (-),score=117.65 TRINITY_DN13037_c0_g1_i1:259-1179(-)